MFKSLTIAKQLTKDIITMPQQIENINKELKLIFQVPIRNSEEILEMKIINILIKD